MADITITIADVNLADVRDTLYPRWGGTDLAATNPQKVAFLKARVANFIKDEYVIAKGDAAIVTDIETVRQAARSAASAVSIS